MRKEFVVRSSSRSRPILAGALAVFLCTLPLLANASVLVSGSARTDFNWLRRAPLNAFGVEDGATNLEGWFDFRGQAEKWDASVRLRIHESAGISDDPPQEEIDRRHLAYRTPDLEIVAGHFYTTFGNGLVLRTIEQRFVTLNRSDRAFNLDRNIDGVMVKLALPQVEGSVISGRPGRTGLSESVVGGAIESRSDDLLQGVDLNLTQFDQVTAGVSFLRAELADPQGGSNFEGREEQDLVSYRLGGNLDAVSGEFEYAEARPTGALRDELFLGRGIARYFRVESGVGDLAVSLEGKSYKDFDFFPYNQPPTLVRTHESALLNRATHVLLPDDERGIQFEALYVPEPFTSFVFNVATADDSEYSKDRKFREVFASGRTEVEELGAGRLALGWSRDRIKFVENRYTAALELEGFVSEEDSIILDLEVQASESLFGDSTIQLAQISFSRAGLGTFSITGEHSNSRTLEKRDWLFAALDLSLSDSVDLTLGYGSRPAGLVCSGGFCFVSPEFDGAEFRLLSRF
ncbi:MAG: hypothetical protein HKN21_07830 [Candidatus Eisenbacteria bacterium]|uniref:TIGR03016 family PEP-CTERM system-associated outer membrane protein n=1 Tax=Eiseniibacteriota bacterium TaxID=2212470 RepID=A0A7Y2EB67_UNCEI|nr:hypothetical protein [Candidatus Eisenbacteria bacterium]